MNGKLIFVFGFCIALSSSSGFALDAVEATGKAHSENAAQTSQPPDVGTTSSTVEQVVKANAAPKWTPLPKMLSGTWEMLLQLSTESVYTGTASARIDVERADDLTGVMSFGGLACYAANIPMTGKRVSSNRIVMRGKTAKCGLLTYDVTEVTSGVWEGPYEMEQGSPGKRKVRLMTSR